MNPRHKPTLLVALASALLGMGTMSPTYHRPNHTGTQRPRYKTRKRKSR